MKQLVESPYLVFLSLVLGAALALIGPAALDASRDEYDRSHPVWVPATVSIKERTADTVRLHVVGEKMRDCKLLRTWGQAMYAERAATDVYIVRDSGQTIGYRNRPLGRQDLGDFVLLAVPQDATSVVMHVEHDCSGRVVRSELAQAALPTSNR